MSPDFRQSVRSLSRSPGFTAAAVVLVALGVGSVTAIWSVVEPVLLRALPYDAAARLVYFDNGSFSGPKFRDWQERGRNFDRLAGVWVEGTSLVGGGPPLGVQVGQVTTDFLGLFDARAEVGRLFVADDFEPPQPVVLISHRLWSERYGADPGLVGRAISVGGAPTTVVGVLARDFVPPEALLERSVAIWRPIDFARELLGKRNVHVLQVAGLLASGTSLAKAQEDIDRINGELAVEFPDVEMTRDKKVRSTPLRTMHEATVGAIRARLSTLLGAVSLLLLIAAANVAGLFLARSAARLDEMSLRTALGASRSRLVRLLLTESVCLAIAGGVLGVGLAWLASRAFVLFAPQDIPRADSVGVDGRVALFAFVVALLTGIGFGVVPAWRATRGALVGAARGEGAGLSRGRNRLGLSLVALQLALAVMLLVGAGLLFRSFFSLAAVDPGFSPQHLVRIGIERGGFDDGTDEARLQFSREVLESLTAVPGVSSAAASWVMPFDEVGGGRCCWGSGIRREGEEENRINTYIHPVTPGFFETLGVPLLAGHEFGWEKRVPAQAVLGLELARGLAGGEAPESLVGRLVRLGRGEGTPFEVVGISDSFHYYGLEQKPEELMFVPYAEFGGGLELISVVLRSELPLDSLAVSLRAAVWEVDGDQPIQGLWEVPDRISQSVGAPRFYSSLLGIFAVVSLLLAAAGVYATLLYSVNRRRGELGLRAALGARRGQLSRLVVGQAVAIALVGAVVGLVGAAFLSRFLRGFLFGIDRFDPWTLGLAPAVLLVVVLGAAYFPARRAASADPLETLRGH